MSERRALAEEHIVLPTYRLLKARLSPGSRLVLAQQARQPNLTVATDQQCILEP